MNPGLLVKLRPSGPWRIGPDSGARNRVDVIYHSDSLYSAITSAMSRLGWMEEWLDATARRATPVVSFGSCFPFLDDLGFVVPPRTVWPPASTSTRAERVRWRSARFIPLKVVQSILAGKRLDENQWSVDGPSDCLVPSGRPGPFRTAVRWSAGVDRLTGATERHSTACLEFRPGAGLWTAVSFADDAARDAWSERVKAAFRLLADSGFGGERSRGWGRAETPEFIEGTLPELILPLGEGKVPEVTAPPVSEVVAVDNPSSTPSTPEPEPEALVEAAVLEPSETAAMAGWPDDTPRTGDTPEPPPPEPEAPIVAPDETPAIEAAASQPPVDEETPATPEPAAEESPAIASNTHPHWLLSVFTPATADAVDWRRGNYTVLARGGRVESPSGSGGLKKQIHMVAEGSVIYAETTPRGSAADVAPDGFTHPVFRAGFALAIPLPEVQ